MSETKSRHEVWSLEQDNLLINTVLKHLATDSNQRNAYEEVAHEIDRTAGACAFRFNSVLRRQFRMEILSAKLKKSKSPEGIQRSQEDANIKKRNEVSSRHILNFLNLQELQTQKMEQQLIDIKKENISLKKELEYFKEVRNKMESFGMNITKMLIK